MKIRLLAAIGAAALSLGLLAPAPARPLEGDPATEDVLYLNDGRELHGQIVEETRSAIIFQFTDRASGISTKLTFDPSEIARIDRDIVIEASPADEGAPTPAVSRPAAGGDEGKGDSDWATHYGVRRASAHEDVPSFYLVPMSGQMGTDIHFDVYEKIIDDIRAVNPDYLVIVMDCKDHEDRLMSRIEREEAGFNGSTFLDMYRNLVAVFRHELRDIPQVLWIEDSLGISSVIALSWSEIYMKPHARLGGIAGAARNFAVSDEEKKAKFREGYMGWLKGFAEYGGYSLSLIDAMVIPDYKLSASWKGRDVTWRLDTNGEYIVDNSDEATTEFRAKTAEDFCISKGTVETLDDLAMLLGVREYRVAPGSAEKIVEDYKEDWRRTWDNVHEWYIDYEQAMGWANGEDALRYLGKAKNLLERILAALDRYNAIETRLATEYGVDRRSLQVQIELLRERIRALRDNRGGGGGGRGRGGGAGPGSGGG